MKKGSKMTPEQRKRVSEAHKGYKFPESQKQKMSESMKALDRSGANNPNWQGGYYLTSSGYLAFSYGKNRHQLVHRYVMEQKIGRRLTSKEVVHHKNGDKLDNHIENLQILTRYEHGKLHGPGGGTSSP